MLHAENVEFAEKKKDSARLPRFLREQKSPPSKVVVKPFTSP